MRPEPILLPLHILPAKLQPLVDPKQGGARRLAVAKAALPLPPAEMAAALAYLVQDSDRGLAEEAKRSLLGLPEASLLDLLQSHETHAAIIDTLVRLFSDKELFIEKALLNRVTSEQTLLWVASEGKGQALELIAQNQARLMACPALVKSLYFNRHLRMATAAAMMEFAVRSHLPIQDMPGYNEIVAAVLGEARVLVGQPPAAQVPPATAAEATAETAKGISDANEALLQAVLRPDSEEELKLIEEQLRKAEAEGDEAAVAAAAAAQAKGEAEAEDAKKSGSLYDAVREMSIPQRIRLALMGNVGARKLLAADSNRLVAGAVMRNPGLTDKEVALMASNKSANDEVIRIICSSRELMKNYRVKLGLVRNPKTPPGVAASLMKHILEKDLKALSKSRDVPSTIARNAKRIIDERRMSKKGEE